MKVTESALLLLYKKRLRAGKASLAEKKKVPVNRDKIAELAKESKKADEVLAYFEDVYLYGKKYADLGRE